MVFPFHEPLDLESSKSQALALNYFEHAIELAVMKSTPGAQNFRREQIITIRLSLPIVRLK
jgi:hypothetical protein